MIKHIFLALLIFTNTVFAFNPKDPIAYDVLKSIPSSITTNGGVYVESMIFKNQTGYTLVHPLQIGKSASPAGEFTYTDNCSGQLLTNGQTCTVQADLTPVTNGTKTLQFIIEGYSKKQVPVPQPAVTTTASGNTSVSVTGAFTASPWLTTMSVGQSQNFTFSFTNNGSASATGIGISCSNAATCTNNCGSSLLAGASCTVSGTFTATSAMANSSQTVSAALKYNQGSTVTVNSTAVHINPASGFVGTVIPSTASLVQSQGVQVVFTYTNYNPTTVSIPASAFSHSTLGSGQTFSLSGTGDQCSGQTVGVNGGTCTVTGTYTDTNAAPSSISLTGTVTPNAPTAAASATATLSVTGTSTGARTITFTNNCPAGYNVWVGMNSAAYTVAGGDAATPVTKTCSTQADCPTGTTCNAGTCYWNTYATSSGSFELAPSGGTTTIVIPATAAIAAEGLDAAHTIFWSGGFAGRTGCTGSGCVTADCGQGTDGCQPGVGFNAPDTQAEMTLQPSVTDTYDLETIDGFNIPVSITPGAGASPVSGYSCSIAGDFSAQGSGNNQFSGCNWSLSPNNFPSGIAPATFYWVDNSTAHPCTSQTDCSGYPNTICGIAQVPVNPGVSPPKVAEYCGRFLGYMTAKQACAYDIPNGSTNAQTIGFNCNTNTTEGGQVSNLYGCTDTYHPSCYSAGTPCCGCEKWQSVLPANSIPTSSPEQCVIQDPNWLTYVPDNITWMKKTCSNVYTYPYDDKTSTFTCSNGGTNSLNYTVTFCPGGNSGIPSTYSSDEGRNG